MKTVRVGIVGDFDHAKHSHWATEAALFHSAARAGVVVEPRWISTTSLVELGTSQIANLAGVWGAPGSPYVSMQGMLNAIRFVREQDIPYLGTCGGFQHAVIEFSRNVLGIADADSAEHSADGKNIVIRAVSCSVAEPPQGSPRLRGLHVARPVSGSLFATLCGGAELQERYFCNFEANSEYLERWEAAGLRVGALGPEGEVRAVELPKNRFFVATLFQPQLSSSFDRPHPIIEGYLRACASSSHTTAVA